MSFRKNLRKANWYLFLGTCLILIGFLIYSQKNQVTPISPTPLITPTSQISFAKVARVIDGDTIQLENGDRVRYIGMNTPEVESNECYATEATEINKNLVLGKEIRLEKDTSETDKYGRLLRYVYVGDEFVNNELVKNGFAKVMTVPPDVKYNDVFVRSQEYAKASKLGLWSNCPE